MSNHCWLMASPTSCQSWGFSTIPHHSIEVCSGRGGGAQGQFKWLSTNVGPVPESNRGRQLHSAPAAVRHHSPHLLLSLTPSSESRKQGETCKYVLVLRGITSSRCEQIFIHPTNFPKTLLRSKYDTHFIHQNNESKLETHRLLFRRSDTRAAIRRSAQGGRFGTQQHSLKTPAALGYKMTFTQDERQSDGSKRGQMKRNGSNEQRERKKKERQRLRRRYKVLKIR